MEIRAARLSKWMAFFVAAAVVAALGVAHADLTPKVVKKFKGKILITNEPLNLLALGDSKTTIKACDKRKTAVVKHELVEGTPTWAFYYTAFLTAKPRVTTLTFEFYHPGPDGSMELRADKTMVDIDRTLKTLQGRINISEDDNVDKGKTYTVKLVDNVRGNSKVYATTKLTFR